MDKVITHSMIEQLGSIPTSPKLLGEVDPAVATEFANLLHTASLKPSDTTMTSSKAPSATTPTNINTLQSAGPISALPPLATQQDQPLLPSPLLGALHNLSSEYEKNITTVRDTIAAAWDQEEGIGGLQMLEAQYALANSSTSLAIASKVAGSLTSGINQLVKTQ